MGDLIPLRTSPATVDPGEGPLARPPPADLDAEAAVLSAILLDRDALDRVQDILKPEHFFSHANARIFRAAQALAAASTPIDMISVSSWLRDHEELRQMGGTTYLAQLADATPAVTHVATHARAVLETFERRQYIWTAERHAAELRAGAVADWAAFKAHARPEWGRLTAPRVELAGRSAGAVVADARAHVRAAAGGAVGVRYPWAAVERLVGLLLRGRQTVLAGLSEHGKTALAMQVVCSVACAKPDASGFGEAVYVMTGEMPGPALILRTACSMAGVDVARIDGGFAHADEHAEVDRWLLALEALPIIIDDKPAPAVEVAKRVRAHKTAFEQGRARDHKGNLWPRCRLQLVMGDHVQDLADLETGRDEKDRIFRSAKGWVEDIAKGCDVATLLLSMLRALDTTATPNKFPAWPSEQQLFGAPNAIKRTADTILAVQRPELLMRGKVPAKWLGVAGVSRLKSRFGGDGVRALLGFDRGMFANDLPAAARGEPHYDDE